MAEATIHTPPFPPLHWHKYYWIGEVVLPSWAGFQTRRGTYGSVTAQTESDGSAQLTVAVPDDELQTAPSPEQARAFQLLLENESAVARSALRAIFTSYPRLRQSYGFDTEDPENVMPAIQRPEQLRPLIGLSAVHVLTVVKDSVAYIGFELGCTWDEEHGLGVMMHRVRVIKVGGADTSFLEWIAEDDAEANR